ncbi:MAG: hypothetical protein IKJ59_02625 [Clostridia bacterium]|nr:hypothetical protein [Clostridia bacterium]
MLFKSILSQCKIIYKQKLFLITVFIIYVFIIINYARNVKEFYGADVSAIIHPMKMTLLNTYGKWGFYFMQYVPLILVLPASFSFMNDKSNDTKVYLSAKFGVKNYYYGKLVAVFTMTFLAFFIPLVFEYILNIVTFPIQAVGDRSNLTTFDNTYNDKETRYLFFKLWRFNPYIYFFVFIAMFSFVMASFSTFVVSTTMFQIIKFKILAFLPAYSIFTFSNASGAILGIRMNYQDYLMAFDSGEKIDSLYLVISLLLLFISAIIVRCRGTEEI